MASSSDLGADPTVLLRAFDNKVDKLSEVVVYQLSQLKPGVVSGTSQCILDHASGKPPP